MRPRVDAMRTGRADRGSATAELAVALPALILLMFVALTAVRAVLTTVECVDAAREAARAAARGAVAAGQLAAPPGAIITVSADGATVRATVQVRVHPLGGELASFVVRGSAVAAIEPGGAS